MAHPWIDEDNFEHGSVTGGHWTAETDTDGVVDVPHYSELARDNLAGANAMPFRGAYCLRVLLNGGTNPSLLASTNVTQAAANVGFHRFMFQIGTDVAFSADDILNIAQLLNGTTVEVALSLRLTNSTDRIELGIGETAASAWAGDLQRGLWYAMELRVDVDGGTANDGTIDSYLSTYHSAASSAVHNTQITGLNQGAIESVELGIENQLSTTTGTFLYDEYIHDDARVYPITERFPKVRRVTTSGHVFVGRGEFTVTTLDGGSGDGVVTVYDTDRADTNDYSNVVAEVREQTADEQKESLDVHTVHRGCYVNLAGTNTQALIHMKRASAYNNAGLRRQGLRAPSLISL